MNLEINEMKKILEAALFAAGEPLSLERLMELFEESERPSREILTEMIKDLANCYQESGVELAEVASGYRFQARSEYANWLQRLWEKKPPRYSRALLETLALIVYRQPITRGEVEDIRGVAVSTNIMKILLEHGWIKIVGHKDVPGKPAVYGTTQQFLDYFNLKNLSELPPLQELLSFEEMEKKLTEETGVLVDQSESEDMQENLQENTQENSQEDSLESCSQDNSQENSHENLEQSLEENSEQRLEENSEQSLEESFGEKEQIKNENPEDIA